MAQWNSTCLESHKLGFVLNKIKQDLWENVCGLYANIPFHKRTFAILPVEVKSRAPEQCLRQTTCLGFSGLGIWKLHSPRRIKTKSSAPHLQNLSLGRGLPDPTDVYFLLCVTCPSMDHISPSVLSLCPASVFPTQDHVTSD